MIELKYDDIRGSALPVWAKTIAMNVMEMWGIESVRYDETRQTLQFERGSVVVTANEVFGGISLTITGEEHPVTVPITEVTSTLYRFLGG